MKKIFGYIIYGLTGSMLLFACQATKNTKKEEKVIKPNIVWIVTEDLSPVLSFYGDHTAKTPHLDALAKESMIYDNAYATVGVCAPSRSAIITGMYPTSIGTIHMRTGKDVFGWGKRIYLDSTKVNIRDLSGKKIRQYSAVIPGNVKCFTEYLRKNGYYCTNNPKTDYQFAAPLTAWDENSWHAHWKHRPGDKPFFAVFNIGDTHESRLWRNENLPLTVSPDSVPVPPFLPDNAATRESVARMYSNVELMDNKVGILIKELKDAGLYDNTIIFFYSDHGGPLPREKREIYDTGLKVPFLVKDINSRHKGRTDRMISFVDLAPTVLSLTHTPIPDYMEGKAFLGDTQAPPRQFIYGSSDRFDEYSDRIRSARNKRYLYVRNDYPQLPKYKDIHYRKKIPMMPEFLRLHREGKLNPVQESWFQTKTVEELYDCQKDPYQLHDISNQPGYKAILEKMRQALKQHFDGKKDYGKIPESELISLMWPGYKQPITQPVRIEKKNGKYYLNCPTKAASIAYLITDKPVKKLDFDAHWQVYYHPLKLQKGLYLTAVAQRIGFKESVMTSIKNE